jgi:DNA processing protein
MYGVDALAHQTALTHGGRTVGVLGYGFDHIYPRHHRSLEAQVLAQGGCLVTELAPMVSPTPGTFPARNRIIAGLSQAVVVTEAAEQSGSHITASYALDYGRVVAAVPGPITNYFSQGTKNLLKQGAVMISSGYELLDELGVQSTSPKLVNGSQLADEVSIALLEAVGLQPGTIDELAHRLQFSLPQITVALTMLELTQQLKKVGDTWYLTSSQ